MNCSEFEALLNDYIDSASVLAELEAHAKNCEACRKKLSAAKLYKDFVPALDDDIYVPLKAQAAWRNAVKAEAKKKKTTRWIKGLSAVAALCFVCVGIAGIFNKNDTVPQSVALEADSAEIVASECENVVLEAAETVEYSEYTLTVANTADASKHLGELIAEYEGTVEQPDDRHFYVSLPEDNLADFENALSAIGTGSGTLAIDSVIILAEK